MAASTPVSAWREQLHATSCLTQSGYVTMSIHITQAWGVKIPIVVGFPTTASVDAEITVHRTTDNGITFDSFQNPYMSAGVARVANSTSQRSIELPTGQYAIVVCNGGANVAGVTFSIYAGTCEVFTAVAS